MAASPDCREKQISDRSLSSTLSIAPARSSADTAPIRGFGYFFISDAGCHITKAFDHSAAYITLRRNLNDVTSMEWACRCNVTSADRDFGERQPMDKVELRSCERLKTGKLKACPTTEQDRL